MLGYFFQGIPPGRDHGIGIGHWAGVSGYRGIYSLGVERASDYS